MVFKILQLIALVMICSASPLTYPRGSQSHHATYSQSFTREDVPLSYKYSAVHIYPENIPRHKPLEVVNNPGLNPTNYGGIQYAPLPFKREEEKHQDENGIFSSDVYTQGTNPMDYHDPGTSEHSTESTVKSEHLEPKLLTSNPTFTSKSPMQFVPGHNIVPSPYRGLNLKDYHGTNSQSQNLVNYMHEFKNYENQEQTSRVSTERTKMVRNFAAVTTDSPKQESYMFMPKHNYQKYQPYYQTKVERFPMEQLAARAKVPQLHLNIAREFKFAHMPQAAPAHVSLSRFHSFPLQTHTQAIVSQLFPRESYKNATRLYPTKLHVAAYNRS